MKILICDIDGVLNYYPETIITFAEKSGYKRCETLKELKESLSYLEYKELKLNYRKSSYKHNAKVRKDAKKLLKYFKSKDYFIVLLTARDCNEEMIIKTSEWLKKNNLYFDYLYFSAKKDLQIYQRFGSASVIIDDSVNNLEIIHKIKPNSRYYLVNGPDNSLYKEPKYIKRVFELNEIIEEEEHV